LTSAIVSTSFLGGHHRQATHEVGQDGIAGRIPSSSLSTSPSTIGSFQFIDYHVECQHI
jgi:hypothetical protein